MYYIVDDPTYPLIGLSLTGLVCLIALQVTQQGKFLIWAVSLLGVALVWFAVELDDEESRDTAGVAGVPPQLLFVHYMELVKECHWHPQAPGLVMATGGAGFG